MNKADKKAAVREFLAAAGRKGGAARAAKLSPEQRSEIAKRAWDARKAKADKTPKPAKPPKVKRPRGRPKKIIRRPLD